MIGNKYKYIGEAIGSIPELGEVTKTGQLFTSINQVQEDMMKASDVFELVKDKDVHTKDGDK